MRTIPNMRVMVPIDATSLPTLLAGEPRGPLYLRFGEGLEPLGPFAPPEGGRDLVVVALGEMAIRCAPAVSALRKAGFDVGLVGIERLCGEELRQRLDAAGSPKRLVVVEDHIALGGLGAFVRDLGFDVARHLHLPLNVEAVTNTEAELVRHYGFDTASVKRALHELLGD